MEMKTFIHRVKEGLNMRDNFYAMTTIEIHRSWDGSMYVELTEDMLEHVLSPLADTVKITLDGGMVLIDDQSSSTSAVVYNDGVLVGDTTERVAREFLAA
jgi:hypothetical protein